MTSPKDRVLFNGVNVVKWWPAHLARSQEKLTYLIEGREYSRVAFGSEREAWGVARGPCHDCAALSGQLHALGCDVERCPVCGGQPFACECSYDEPEPEIGPPV